MKLNINNVFSKELPADSVLENERRQVYNACFSYASPKQTAKPTLLHVSPSMLKNLGLSSIDAKSKYFLNIFSGNQVLESTKPYAMCYGGHQFGNWAGQLGDGRAINLFEIKQNNNQWQVQLKGAGVTPYSRTADGLAVLRSSVREYLCSEAMFYLGVPTTRALSLSLSGDKVLRDVMYDGNPAYEKGAVVCRAAESFLRFGSYQIFASRQDNYTLKTLVDYTIKHHFTGLGTPSKDTYIQFFKTVSERTLNLIIHWQRVGFVHGVMNTDNMSILGLTIDYGPYGWLEGFDYGWTPNTTDRQHKRYRFGNQINIGLWNLLQLANAIYPLINEAEPLEAILNEYKTNFEIKSLAMMRSKLGLEMADKNDEKFILDLEDILHQTETDMTIFFRQISNFEKKKPSEGLKLIHDAFYAPSEVVGDIKKRWENWFNAYAERLQCETCLDKARKEKMNLVNPKYVLRNYMSQLAIDKADNGDYGLLDELFKMLQNPYSEQPEYNNWFAKRPDWARDKVGCSMLSCSS